MKRLHPVKLNREKGLSTLVIVLLLLFVATLVTMYTANSTVREQQVSANQYRADQALSAANAGLDYALAYYAKNSGPDAFENADPTNLEGDGIIDPITVPTLSGDGQQVFADVSFVDASGGTSAFDGPHTLTSVGFSDDRSATRTITIQVDVFGLLPGGGLPGFPLIAKGIAASGGNFSIINRFSNATIWTGADATALGSAETYVLDPLNPPSNRAELIDFSGSPDPNLVLHASYSQAGLNSDVIEADDNLVNMTNDEFFQSFMRENKPTLRSMADSIGQRFDADQITWNDLEVSDGIRGLVWIDGDWSESGSMNTLGTEEYPITLIINGDFTTTGTGAPGLDVIGLIYIIGDWDSGGNFEVQGGVIVEGNVDNSGTPTIVYDENLYDGSLGNPPGTVGTVPAGTWKDW
jgi:hypothetical protein